MLMVSLCSVRAQRVDESPLHKPFNQRNRIRCQVALGFLLRYADLGPDNDMSDIRCETIRPVIQKDFVVIRVSEGDGIIALK